MRIIKIPIFAASKKIITKLHGEEPVIGNMDTQIGVSLACGIQSDSITGLPLSTLEISVSNNVYIRFAPIQKRYELGNFFHRESVNIFIHHVNILRNGGYECHAAIREFQRYFGIFEEEWGFDTLKQIYYRNNTKVLKKLV